MCGVDVDSHSQSICSEVHLWLGKEEDGLILSNMHGTFFLEFLVPYWKMLMFNVMNDQGLTVIYIIQISTFIWGLD